MKHKYIDRIDNIYMIDTKMFGFDKYQSSYIVAGKEIALVDTGVPPSLDVLREGINKHGFSIQDISRIFVTHCEHPDHSGNVGSLLLENPKAEVFINPLGTALLTNPEIEDAKRRSMLPDRLASRFGKMVPVDPARIKYLKDGEIIDLGGGEILKVFFTPGHQPSGIVIYEEKNKGLFINDLCGLYLQDVGASWIFTPYGSDVALAYKSLKKIINLPISNLCLGHFGFCDKPMEVIQGAIRKIEMLLDIGAQCIQEGKEDDIAVRVQNNILIPELKKFASVREPGIYEYLSQELVPYISRAFADYYLRKNK